MQNFCPDEGYWLAFSGGKDSLVLKTLADMAEVKYDAHFNLTTVDPPEVLRYTIDHHADVVFEKPETTMWKLILKKRLPPTRRVRYCCEIFKEVGGRERVVLTGIRWAESVKRRERKMVETCYKHKSKTYVNPIIDWTHQEVWAFIYRHKLEYCDLYREGWHRIGCIGCPMAYWKTRIKEFRRWPKFRKAYIRTFEKLIASRLEAGLKTGWEIGEDVMKWWLEIDDDEENGQLELFSMFE
jgi:phosphoadenosine phosphosulfate reductase